MVGATGYGPQADDRLCWLPYSDLAQPLHCPHCRVPLAMINLEQPAHIVQAAVRVSDGTSYALRKDSHVSAIVASGMLVGRTPEETEKRCHAFVHLIMSSRSARAKEIRNLKRMWRRLGRVPHPDVPCVSVSHPTVLARWEADEQYMKRQSSQNFWSRDTAIIMDKLIVAVKKLAQANKAGVKVDWKDLPDIDDTFARTIVHRLESDLPRPEDAAMAGQSSASQGPEPDEPPRASAAGDVILMDLGAWQRESQTTTEQPKTSKNKKKNKSGSGTPTSQSSQGLTRGQRLSCSLLVIDPGTSGRPAGTRGDAEYYRSSCVFAFIECDVWRLHGSRDEGSVHW